MENGFALFGDFLRGCSRGCSSETRQTMKVTSFSFDFLVKLSALFPYLYGAHLFFCCGYF